MIRTKFLLPAGLPALLPALLLALLLAWAGPAAGAPRYTDRENALNLAETLDKGIFQQLLITSTFIQSAGPGNYFIKVILDNGAEENWDLRQLRAFTRGESLVLKNNRALLFPDEDTNRFVVFDKNRFARAALEATVYVKAYPSSDVLAGQELKFSVQRFNLVNLLDLKASRDERGYPRRYILELENGQRDSLSYLEAFRVFERNGLVADPATVTAVLRAPYRLRQLKKHEIHANGVAGTGQFSVEMVFDRPVEMEPGHFPFRIFETDRGSGGRRSNFVVEITAPNTTLPGPIPAIDSLEFLQNIRTVSDPVHPGRVLLRANLAPEVMNFPPQVAVEGPSVLVSFTKVVDQTVMDQKALQEAELRARQEKMLSRTLAPEEIEQRRNYRAQMAEGANQLSQARVAPDFAGRLDLYDGALASFAGAAGNASSDRELQAAIRQRNALLIKIPQAVVDHVSRGLEKGGDPQAAQFRQWLEKAALMTRDSALRGSIQRLLRHPNLG